jgi:hypothetical protein
MRGVFQREQARGDEERGLCWFSFAIPVPPYDYEGGIQGGFDGPAAWHASASPGSPRWDNQIPCLVPHTGDEAPVVRGLVSIRRGSEELGMIAPFWPGACATNQRFAPIRVLAERREIKLHAPFSTPHAYRGNRASVFVQD